MGPDGSLFSRHRVCQLRYWPQGREVAPTSKRGTCSWQRVRRRQPSQARFSGTRDQPKPRSGLRRPTSLKPPGRLVGNGRRLGIQVRSLVAYRGILWQPAGQPSGLSLSYQRSKKMTVGMSICFARRHPPAPSWQLRRGRRAIPTSAGDGRVIACAGWYQMSLFEGGRLAELPDRALKCIQ